MMKEKKQFEGISPNHKEGLIVLTKNLVKFLVGKLQLNEIEEQSIIDKAFLFNESEDIKEFVKCLSGVSSIKNYIPKFIIESYCREFIKLLIKENITEDDKISKEIDRLLVDLESRIDEWNVVIPLENITLNEIDSLEIGDALILNSDKMSEILKDTAMIKDISGSPFFSIQKEIKNNVCACIKVKYDSQEIYEPALDRIEPIINILRIYAYRNPGIMLSSPINAARVKIGICGTANAAKRLMISFKPGKGWGARISGSGFHPNLVLDRDFLKSIERNYKFKSVNDLLCKSEPSKYERQILTAIRWIGLGIDDDIGSDKVIKFSIALECLILYKDETSKSLALAERCAYILGINSEERRKIQEKVKDLYDLRSRIVHDGENSINDKDIDELRELATKCLFKILEIKDKYKLEGTEDLKKLIQGKKSEVIYQFLPDQPWF
jgi:hypothetical protein